MPSTTQSAELLRSSRRRRALAALALAGATGAAVMAPAASAQSAQLAFEQPVLLTTHEGDGGFEPSLVVDAHDNVWVTAHRADAATRDGRSAAGRRSASWLWFSSDGRTFSPPPGLVPTDVRDLSFGLEGDLAADGAGNVHFVDLGAGKISYSTWRSTGRGKVTPVRTLPAHTAPIVDRPFLSANGDTVLLAVNDFGGSPTAPTDADLIGGEHQGAYSMYLSRDGGATFTVPGSHFRSTRFCRPHVSPQDATLLVAVCTTSVLTSLDDATVDSGLAIYVSRDGGATWTRNDLLQEPTPVRYDSFPSIAETPDGVLHALYTQMTDDGASAPQLLTSRVLLTSSHDRGRSWTTPRDPGLEKGLWQHASISADRHGRLGVAGYHRPNRTSPWTFRAAVWTPRLDRRPVVLRSYAVAPGQISYPADEENPQGEFTQADFDSRGKLHVTYGVREAGPADGLPAADGKRLSSSKVYVARQR